MLAPGREKSVARFHPWIFSGAIAEVGGSPSPGETVRVESGSGVFLAWGAYSPQSQIRVRLWSWREADRIDEAFLDRRIAAAIARRGPHGLDPTGAARLVNAEADGLPGLIVDRYADVLVLQFLSSGAERWRDATVAALQARVTSTSVYERSDAEVRTLEGMAPRTGLLAQAGPPALIECSEGIDAHRCRYLVDVRHGHKTGFYLDQAQNRARIGALSAGRSMLNCFAYTGGFALAALAHGARRVVSIESSAEALRTARLQVELNGFDPARAEWIEADVFARLRNLRDAGERFELIVLDPPKFAPTAHHVQRAARAYKDINLLGFQLLAPGGRLATFSCSGAIDAALFQSIVAGAAQDAGVTAQIEAHLQAAHDHPVTLAFPEGDYLKGLLLERWG